MKKVCDTKRWICLALSVTRRIHMIKLRKFLSNFGEDALLVSGLLVVFLGLYLLLAYLIIRF